MICGFCDNFMVASSTKKDTWHCENCGETISICKVCAKVECTFLEYGSYCDSCGRFYCTSHEFVYGSVDDDCVYRCKDCSV